MTTEEHSVKSHLGEVETSARLVVESDCETLDHDIKARTFFPGNRYAHATERKRESTFARATAAPNPD